MKQKLLCLLAAFAFLLPTRLSAFEYTYEGATLRYDVLDEDAKTCEVGGYSSLPDSGDVIIPDVANDGTTDYTVISIGESAFYSSYRLTSVEIPNSVTSIGESAFESCNSLESVEIPNSVISIGRSAFKWCGSLTSVLIGNSVTSIGGLAFYQCESLKSVEIGNSVTSIGSAAFYKCRLMSVVIPNSVTEIGESAFAYCSGMTSVLIGKSVTSIGKDAFAYCSSLIKSAYPSTLGWLSLSGKEIAYNPKEVVIEDGWIWNQDKTAIYFAPLNLEGEYSIPESVTSIGRYAFHRCEWLTSVEIPNSVTSIGGEAFSYCLRLTSVIIPNSVTSIDGSAFGGCSYLIKSAYPSTLQNPFSDGTAVAYNPKEAVIEDGWIWNQDKTAIYFAPINIEGEYSIPESVTSIGDNAFCSCSGLTSVTIPNSVTSIGENAFRKCSSLTSVAIPNSVTEIGAYAFAYCTGMTSVLIGKSVTEIGSNAFYECEGLNDIIVSSATPAAMNDNSFEGLYRTVSLTVPGEAVNDYLATNWSLFYNINAGDSNVAVKRYSDGVFEYRLNPVDFTAAIVGAKSCTDLQIPERFTDDSDTANPVRYYINGIGYKAFYRKGVKNVTFNSRSQMEYIGDYAFGGNTALSSIEFPETVMSIGKHAFEDCTGLSEVKISESINKIDSYTFSGCTNLKSISIPSSVEVIGDNAFNATALTSVTIPSTVAEIGEQAFYNTKSLAVVVFNEGLKTIGARAFSASDKRSVGSTFVYIPTTVSEIGNDAFLNLKSDRVKIDNLAAWCGIEFGNASANPLGLCGKLSVNDTEVTELQIPSGIEEIKPYAFAGFSNLKALVLPDEVKQLGEYCFSNCDKLTSVVIADSDKAIEISQESGLLSTVTDLYMGRMIEGDSMFSNLINLTIGDLIEELNPAIYNTSSKLATVVLGNGLMEIGENAFKNFTNLTNVKFGSGIQTIGANAFRGCTSLGEVVLSPSVESIGASAFAANSNLASIIMGHNVKSIGEKAFDGCVASTISITAQTPPTAPNNTFSNYSGKLYLQGQAAVDAYYDAFTCWDRFSSYVMIEPTDIVMEGDTKIDGKPGDTIQLKATLMPENVTLPQIFWRSTNPEIATVDANGLVTLHADLEDVLTRADGQCKIIAESLYANGPLLEVPVTVDGSGVDEVVIDSSKGEIDYELPYEVYDIRGIKVGVTKEDLSCGIYIIRQGNVVKKIAVK